MSPRATEEVQKRILIIDDDADIAMIISELISQLSIPDLYFAIETANSGKQGLELLHKKKFDLLITDLRMPELPGDHLIQELRIGNSENRMVPVILLSGYLKDLANSSSIQSLPGTLYILEKPVQYGDLSQVIQIWLGEVNSKL